MRMASPVRWVLAIAAGLTAVILAYGGIYQLVVVTVPGTATDPGYVIAYRLNRFTGSVAVCDTSGCDIILGWFAPGPKTSRDDMTPEKPAPQKTRHPGPRSTSRAPWPAPSTPGGLRDALTSWTSPRRTS